MYMKGIAAIYLYVSASFPKSLGNSESTPVPLYIVLFSIVFRRLTTKVLDIGAMPGYYCTTFGTIHYMRRDSFISGT